MSLLLIARTFCIKRNIRNLGTNYYEHNTKFTNPICRGEMFSIVFILMLCLNCKIMRHKDLYLKKKD